MESARSGIVLVKTTRGEIPFSVGYLSKTLLAIGISEDQAYSDARNISKIVNARDVTIFSSDEIMEITEQWYMERHPSLAPRVKIIRDDLEKLRPLVILLGGVTGIGKSTLAQLVGSRLGIKSIMGTDLIREVMRMTISNNLVPTLHESSYLAHTKLDTSFLPAMSKHIVGFEQQARSVAVGIEASIEQAIQENEIALIEGVHLVPGIISEKIQRNSRVIFLQLVLKDEKIHKSRLKLRESRQDHRGTEYSKYFREIRDIQDYLIQQAEITNTKIISVKTDEDAVLKIINSIWEQVEAP